ncbi:malonate decarboxylase subunit epsilon [Agrobacterium rubi]|uniref:ACP S-malonyltransferase n=1 Tax=Agrobacterium rubi TaxID=28099 RepID=UPI0015741CA2|nr:malonate decarboxylase subunit epsilon [Agrobacterium rubi]NTF09669.1 malonate decarboxylase subunit epsilon [Agrobacterium rubi]NTF22576.1 malonate decarboxylase subunit epsilon [Agrobacterium rubi]NTF29433.1 malonate decarboxylase subunit epsilon [Agrobacterium rubi]
MTLGILCPGQSAQAPDMIDRLRDAPEAALVFEAFREVMGATIDDILSEGRLHENAIAQPIICVVELAAFHTIRHAIPEPSYFAGYSIGELAAYGCAGSIGARDLIRLASLRAKLMDAAYPEPTGMIAIRGLRETTLAPICTSNAVHIAICNGDDRFVVAGPVDKIALATTDAERHGAHVTRLPVKVASHTPLMHSAVAAFAQALKETDFKNPTAPVLAGIDGASVRSREMAIQRLSAQLETRIDWQGCMESLKEVGCTTLLELLPGGDLSSMARDRLPSVSSRSMIEFKSIDAATQWVSRKEA